MSNFVAWLQSIYRTEAWVYPLFAVVLITMLVHAATRVVMKRLAVRLARTRTFWDDALILAAQGPAAVLTWVLGLSIACELVAPHARSDVFDYIDPARRLAIIALLTWFLVNLINRSAEALTAGDQDRTPVDVTTATAISRLLKMSVWVTAALVALQSLGISISGVLAFGGVGGIAVGFAAKDLLANFFGGLMIYLDRPFAVGDWVRSPDRNIEGTVEHIGWRLTTIRTFDKRPLYVPNSAFATISVENPSRMSHRRIHETIGLRREDARLLPDVLAAVQGMLQQHTQIDANQTLMVHFDRFGDSSLDFFVYCFTKTTVWTEYHQVKQDVLLNIVEIVHAHGAAIAYPVRRLSTELRADSSLDARVGQCSPMKDTHQADRAITLSRN
ncbi:mechanosensitive ion channel family protein [Chitinolyticbacter meiyuanensis]|uniref:mechanosensitive ion channel family protein n=1 Tax=Chitinolyticbacter meiyuanensis TaxID=682798 RepID=UPI0011E59B82|nr:mechanosensitive ion channel family protein [Chitinolyticbacter meiyuanensis]